MCKYILYLGACLCLLASCLQEPVFDEVPFIRFESITKTSMDQRTPDFVDSTLVTIYFEDGDGDLGGDSLAVFVIDKRTDFTETEFRITEIPIKGVSGAISGTISFPIMASCCIYTTGQVQCTPSNPVIEQEIMYEIYIRDRAGNESNRVEVTPINLVCR